MAQNYTEQLRKDNVRDAIYEDLQNNCEVLRTSWSGNAFPANPKVGQPCYRVDEDKLYYWDGLKWSQKGGGGSAELKSMELPAIETERVSIILEGARCLDKNMMFVFVDKIAQDPSTYSLNDDGTVVNFNPAIPANAAVTLRWFDTDVGTFDTAIFASDAEFAAGELTNRAPNVKQVHSLSDQIQTSNANYVKSEFQSNLLNYTTNRILKIPQDIKLELNNGTLTLKAGSKVYVPNGKNADRSNKFDVVTIASDVNYTYTFASSSDSSIMLFINQSGTAFVYSRFESVCFSGETQPSGSYVNWYNTNENKMYSIGANATIDGSGFSFPIAKITQGSNGVTKSIDQVFNGLGYIGSTVFALPGVKVQIPNGRNEDGTYNYLLKETTSVTTTNVSGSRFNQYIMIDSNGNMAGPTEKVKYDSELNSYVYTHDNSKQSWCIFAELGFESGRITSFEPYTVDSVLNSSLSNLSAAGQAKFDAKANVSLDNLNSAGQAKFDAKANIDLSNVNNTGNAAASNLNSKGIRTVVDTYVNGTEWYRIYSDGWIEQGGLGPANSGNKTITLYKPYSNANYTIIQTPYSSAGAGSYSSAIKSQTNTSFVLAVESAYANGFYWQACGY